MMRKYDYLALLVIVLLIFTIPACSQQDQGAELKDETASIPAPTALQIAKTEEQTFTYNGGERTYFLRIPLGLDPAQPAPVILIFHGMSDVPQSMFKAGFASIADQDNIILVYPALISHKSTDFIKQVLIDLSAKVNIDPNRIYAMGFSLGGELTYHVACEMSDTFAAFAAISGMAICEAPHTSDRSVSIIHIHGLGDDLVPYETGKYGMPPVDETISYWVQFDDCVDSPVVEKSDLITHTTYAECRDGAEIELYTIDRMGHKVPTQEMPAAQIIWEFFEEHNPNK